MAFDIQKTAIGLGCVAVIALIFGRSYSSSADSGYESITSLTHLAHSNVAQPNVAQPNMAQPTFRQVASPPNATIVENTMIFPAESLESTDTILESENQISLSIPESKPLEFPEPNQEFMDLEFSDSSMADNSDPMLDAPAIDEATDQSMQMTVPEDQPIETLDLPVEAEDATVVATESPEPSDLKKTVPPQRTSRSKWKQNPFLSTNAPAFSPVERNSENKVQPASMAVTNQAVRSLNVIEGIPPMDAASAPTAAIPTAATPINSNLMTGIGSVITPVQIELTDAVAQKAVHHIEYGKSLTRRGASYAARNEFFTALRVVAEANDAVVNGNDFSKALSRAIQAMKEAEDFAVQDAQSFAVIDVPTTIEAHKTKLLTPIEARQISPRNAMQRYYAYAQQQFDFAGGRNVVTAEALHCLGKLHSVISAQQPISAGKNDVSQAIVFHRSSLLSNPSNSASANELGVLLAKSGELHEATNMFKQSLIAQSTPQAWSNLAKTHQRLGEQQLAHMAEAEVPIAAQSTSIATAGIRWIDTPQFNAMAPLEFEPRIAQKSPQVVPAAAELEANQKGEKPSIAERIKEWF